MYTLEFDHVTKRYGHEVAVDDLTFTVQPGRVTGFLGPNGAGKSTAMKILLDLAKADHGRATIGGTRYREMPDPARTVGVVLEPNAFHPGRTGRNHLRILAEGAGIDPRGIDRDAGGRGPDPRGRPPRGRLLPRYAATPRTGGRAARATHRSWCSTSPATGSTRKASAGYATCSGNALPPEAQCSSPATCWPRSSTSPTRSWSCAMASSSPPAPSPRCSRQARRSAPNRGPADPPAQGGGCHRPHRHRGRARRPRHRHRRDRRPSLRRGNRPARAQSAGRLPGRAVPRLDEHRQHPRQRHRHHRDTTVATEPERQAVPL